MPKLVGKGVIRHSPLPATVIRLERVTGLVSTIVLGLIMAFPPRILAPFLPRFFFVAGLFAAYVSLLATINRVRGLPVRERGVAFPALGLILAAKGERRILSLPLVAGSIAIQIFSLRNGKPQTASGGSHTGQ